VSDVVVASGLVREFSAGGQTVRAVDGVDLTVAAGELLMVLGRSGAGKTTLLSLVGALDRPDSGTISVAGQTVEALSGAERDRFLQRSVGWVFQTSGLIPLLTAAENVELSLGLAGIAGEELTRRALESLALVGLHDRSDHTAAELSGGEQQRVAIARALIVDPPLLLADEPTGNLDSGTGETIIDLLLELHARTGATLLVATHDPAVDARCDVHLAIRDGKVVPPTATAARDSFAGPATQ
jgi:putative ABC transport system ATP-binding protein